MKLYHLISCTWEKVIDVVVILQLIAGVVPVHIFEGAFLWRQRSGVKDIDIHEPKTEAFVSIFTVWE